MSACPSCGGVLGRDCFNPSDCAWITQDMQRQEAFSPDDQPLDRCERLAEEILACHDRDDLPVEAWCPKCSPPIARGARYRLIDWNLAERDAALGEQQGTLLPDL